MASASPELTGLSLVDGRWIAGAGHWQAHDPATGQALDPPFSEADDNVVDEAARAALAAFEAFRQTSPELRARLLDGIAGALEARGDALVARAGAESGLPEPRLRGELGRTCGQLRLFATTLREHGLGEVRQESADPDRQPLPRPALLQRFVPLGPVAVFGASNFPLAFSTAGGDTASALAAGCPVVVKGHPAHPGAGELAAAAILEAVDDLDLPTGVFGLVQSSDNVIAGALVRHPAIRAVGFTGSLAGGRALCDIAATRPDPIPVFAEMGSVNPVFLLPAALAEGAQRIGQGYAQSLLLGEGQFCTNPGLVIGVSGDDLDRFVDAAAEGLSAHQPSPMLTAAICERFTADRDRLAERPGVKRRAEGPRGEAGPNRPAAALYSVTAEAFGEQPELASEVFGPCGLLVECRRPGDMVTLARNLRGQLTATVHAAADDRDLGRRLLPWLERLAGRIVFNGFPTGVEVSPAMVHGGPWPATSDARSTSVGTRAMERFLRPVCYQDLPEGWLAS